MSNIIDETVLTFIVIIIITHLKEISEEVNKGHGMSSGFRKIHQMKGR